jgi:hypothetical protein
MPAVGEYETHCEIFYARFAPTPICHLSAAGFPGPSPSPPSEVRKNWRVVEIGSRIKNFRVGDLVSGLVVRRCPAAGSVPTGAASPNTDSSTSTGR